MVRRRGLEGSRRADNRYYTLEMVQEPQRARACGFGDKDRRPLSPPPIVRLWVRTASGQLVDPNLVSIHFLVLMVDLWSADGTQQRNVVMHPNAQIGRNSDADSAKNPSRPLTAQGSFVGGWKFAGEPFADWAKCSRTPTTDIS